MQLSRVDKVYAHITVTASLADGSPTTLTGVDVAVLAPQATPSASTAWTASTFAAGVAVVLIAGPDADPTGAMVIPAVGADLWVRAIDAPETTTALAGRITVA